MVLAVVPFSISCASGFLIGKAIGEGDVPAVKHYFRLSVLGSLFLGCAFVGILWASKSLIFSFYTSSEEIRAELDSVWPVILVYAFFDVPQYVASGGLRAAGKQGLAALVTWIAYAGIAFLTSWLITRNTDLGL